MSFHGGLTRKQFLTMGYSKLAELRGIQPTCRNVLELMKEYGAPIWTTNRSTDKGRKYGEYQNLRSTFAQLETMHRVVEGKIVGYYAVKHGRPSNGFYLTQKGRELLETYISDLDFKNLPRFKPR
tara:strand:- start:209 stop:583 length:375 start_codon:yes stop_codon:yes gene_type:complete